MSEELNVDTLVRDVLNEMTPGLDEGQISQLKLTLYMHLHGITLTKQCYDLQKVIKENDAGHIQHFAVSKKLAGRSQNTIEQYVRTAWTVRNFIGKNFEDITPVDIRFYFAMMQKNNHWKTSTIETQMRYLNAFYSFLVNEEIILKNPLNKVESVRCEQKRKKPFTSDELERIRTSCSNDIRELALIEFLYASGLRISNVVKLKWKDLNMVERCTSVMLKGGKEKEIYFSEKSVFYLEKMLEERMRIEHRTQEEMMNRPVFARRRRDSITKDFESISTDGVRYMLKEIGKRAGVDDIYPHKFRRTFACAAINRGMPLEELKEHMGHSSYDTTLIYADITTTKLAQSYRTYCE